MDEPEHVYVLYYIRACHNHYYRPYHEVVNIFKTEALAQQSMEVLEAKRQKERNELARIAAESEYDFSEGESGEREWEVWEVDKFYVKKHKLNFC